MYSKEEREVIAKSLEQINAIPSEDILGHTFTNGVDKCCAIGHLARLSSADPNDYSYENCRDFTWDKNGKLVKGNLLPIRALSSRLLSPGVTDVEDWNCMDLSWVNNGNCSLYKQETPKERVVACLEDMLKTEVVEDKVEAIV